MTLTYLFSCVLLSNENAFSQGQTFDRHVSLTVENDALLLLGIDRYYTNGFEFTYRKLKQSPDSIRPNMLFRYSLSQKIYTTASKIWEKVKYFDRPYAGWLFAEAETNWVYQKNIFSLGIRASMTGPWAKGEEMQNGLHRLLGFNEARGWEYQIHNSLGIDITGAWESEISGSRNFRITAKCRGSAGSTITQFAGGPVLEFGRLRPFKQSTLRTHGLGPRTGTPEIVFYINPEAVWQIHDSTIVGPPFDSESPQTAKLEPFYGTLSSGIAYTRGHLATKFYYVLYSPNIKNMFFDWHGYGGITLAVVW
ncbi:lipid A deacylase LpxR family protein [Fulvitalea axinellae]|uniref:lipid A deacylase LpxR family protein n=1 Tax=Fulvitalea axinellae TaxID=1182444 RepID=UPI0030CA2465